MAAVREWLSQIVCFLCLMRVLLHVIPDTGLKKYVRFFLGILFILVVLEPVGNYLGGDSFLANFEAESLRGLQQDLETGKLGLEDMISDWDEEVYQRELEEKIEKIYQTYHIPREDAHTNNQKAGVEDGETEINN